MDGAGVLETLTSLLLTRIFLVNRFRQIREAAASPSRRDEGLIAGR